ncbi:F-box/LRR-repeat protein At4g14096-like [Gastrolobium bilobum]|uniref:F-box/LRR-repeat protein At4g14096-like n=1 Tax=Gastrolobium bilobum TaxID=150636 RepID=UPI002AB0E2FC|nr:F-box/LRR-repeat protein At4g14096-like [Gastrolobium bilobum]
MADRISMLPACVLCHILSFLPTKQVVSTSVLSKTWNPLWRSVSTLHFDFQGRMYNCDLDKEKYSRFVQWVNEVILSRDLHQPIQTFCLRHRTLIVLKLNGLVLKSISSAGLPSLKILHLEEVCFLESKYLAELLSGCPVLEDLVAKDMEFDNSYPRSLTDRKFKSLPKGMLRVM